MKLSEQTTYDEGKLTVPSHDGTPMVVALTPKQKYLLELLISKRGDVVTREETDALWGVLPHNVYGCRRSIDVHIRQLRNLLMFDMTIGIVTAHKRGHYLKCPSFSQESEVTNV